MANTKPIKTKIHPYVREWLQEKYGIAFAKTSLPLQGCTGKYTFDAVFADRKIIAKIKAASGYTSGQKNPS